VTFFWPFSGDYWVIVLDPEYRWAVVGEPDRKYLWILSRTPQLPAADYDQAISAIRAKGYDPSKLVLTHQLPCTVSFPIGGEGFEDVVQSPPASVL
jgi:apolipoprotein D and lipocalin family protein